MADEGGERMNENGGNPEQRRAAAALAERAAHMLREMPMLELPLIEPDDDQLEMGPLDRDFHMLVRNANAVLAEQLAVLGQPVRHGPDGEIIVGMERVAVGLIDELRNMIEHLIRQRDEMRRMVFQRGLLDPLFGQWDELLEVWGVRNASRENGKLKNPNSLESIAIDYVAGVMNRMSKEVYALPLPLLFELYVSLHNKNKLHILRREWSNIDRFNRILSWKMKRMTVHRLFSALLGKGNLTQRILFEELKRRILDRRTAKDMALYECALNFGTFLLDHGSLILPGEIFGYCQRILNKMSIDYSWRQRKLFELNYWLLKYYMSNCSFVEAVNISSFTDTLIDKLVSSDDNGKLDFVQIQTQCACLWYMLGDYQKSMKFCLKALEAARGRDIPVAVQVELLCITAKILVFRRNSNIGLKSVCFALSTVLNHPELERQLCPVLCDYGECLLNSDYVEMAVQVYTVMAKIVQKHFGTDDIRDAQAMYEYAYATYMLLYDNYAVYRSNKEKYIQVRFRCEKFANKALEISRAKLDREHYQLLRAEQLQAMVVTKSSLRNETIQQKALNEAAKVHLRALNKYISFSGDNANCARTYDYLGHIFRLLQRPENSEEMFEKALEAKKIVYGNNDHEVAVTMASLAHLYVKNMNRPREALVLFKKSLEIELNTFGEEYSGLGSIYDGMASAYEAIDDLTEAQDCREQLYVWKAKRHLLEDGPSKNPFGESLCIQETFQDFILKCFKILSLPNESQQSSDLEVKAS